MSEDSEDKKSKTMGGDALVDLMKKPEEAFNNALGAVAKKAAASLWAKFKRNLSTASEPVLRKNMGERYLSGEAHGGGASLWFLATAIALAVPEVRSGAAMLCEMINLPGVGHFFGFWLFTLLVGGAFQYLHFIFGRESRALMEVYRATGIAYHTQSRGIPRWGADQRFVTIGIAAALLLFDFPAGILFIASCAFSAKLSGEQQAAIRSRYLDALDQKIESEYLEDAILGKCPTEITQLHQPLSSTLNEDLRKNIAAAAVGKPVKIVAKGPKSGAPAAAENPAARNDSPAGVSPQPLRNPRAGAPSPVISEPVAPPNSQPETVQQQTGSFTAESPAHGTSFVASAHSPVGSTGSAAERSEESANTPPAIPDKPNFQPTKSTAGAVAPVAAPAPKHAVNFSAPEILHLLHKTWDAEKLKIVLDETEPNDQMIRAALTAIYQLRTSGLRGAFRSKPETAEDSHDDRKFAPEVLDLFQKTLAAWRVEQLVKLKATEPQNLAPDEELIREALKKGYERDGLASLVG
jgi:hypothetical protein